MLLALNTSSVIKEKQYRLEDQLNGNRLTQIASYHWQIACRNVGIVRHGIGRL
jgi:hypothetical protein